MTARREILRASSIFAAAFAFDAVILASQAPAQELDLAAVPTAASAVLDDRFPRATVEFPGGVRAYPAITYAQPPGFRPNTLDLYVPAEPAGEERPLVVFVHGGGWSGGHTRHSGAFADWPGVLAAMAARGYVVASLNYRLSGEAPAPAAIHDVKTAVRWLRLHAEDYGIDPDRVIAAGGSAGGQLAALLATSCGAEELAPPPSATALPGVAQDLAGVSDCVQGAAIWYGIFDFEPLAAGLAATAADAAGPAAGPAAYLGCTPAGCDPEAVRQQSAVAFVDADDPPFLLIHGDQDRVVAVEQSLAFDQALDAAGVESSLIVIEGVDHSFVGATPEATRAASLQALQATVDFIDRVARGN